jgi:hypothetical protein
MGFGTRVRAAGDWTRKRRWATASCRLYQSAAYPEGEKRQGFSQKKRQRKEGS